MTNQPRRGLSAATETTAIDPPETVPLHSHHLVRRDAAVTQITADTTDSRERKSTLAEAIARDRQKRGLTERFLCPGETYPITRAVHFARMASFYPACQHCEHRHSTGPFAHIRTSPDIPAPDERHPLTHQDRLQGTYLNDITHQDAVALGEACTFLAATRETTVSSQPVILLGRDSSPATADILSGMIQGILRTGCDVIDAGVVTRPELDFGTWHAKADAGLFVSIGRTTPAMIDLEVIAADGVQWSRPGRLTEWESCRALGVGRLSRTGGTIRARDLSSDYLKELRQLLPGKGFHRLTLGIACRDVRQREQFTQLLDDASVTFLDVSAIPFPEPQTGNASALPNGSPANRPDVTISLEPGGQACSVYDARHGWIDPQTWLVRIAEFLKREQRCDTLAVGEAISSATLGRLRAHDIELIDVSGNAESLSRAIASGKAQLAANGSGSLWLAHAGRPVCDALATTIELLRMIDAHRRDGFDWAA